MSSTLTSRTCATAVVALVCAGILFAGTSRLALADDIHVPIDEARLVRLDRPGVDVIIGNPSIADVAVQNGQLLVVTGKSFGITNVIVLDAQGREVLHRKVRVRTDQGRMVRVYKGNGRATYDCDTRCETALVPGDAESHFETLSKEVRGKLGIAQSTAEGEQGTQ